MPGQRSKMTDEKLAIMEEMRERGRSYGAIARRLQLSPGAVSWHCLIRGIDPPQPPCLRPIPTRPVAVRRGNHFVRPFTVDEDRRLLALEAQGLSFAELSRQLGRKPNSIRGRLAVLARRDERAEQARAEATA